MKIEQTLHQLASAKKDQQWIRSDLSLSPSTKLGRFLWALAKHSDLLRRIFYGIDLEKSRKQLRKMIPVLFQEENLEKLETLVKTFNAAAEVFNLIAPNHCISLIAANTVSLGGYPDRIEEGYPYDYSPKAFIPSEFSPFFYQKTLQSSKGTLLSFGTFQPLFDFTNGFFEDAILIDFDRAVWDFNKKHLALIAAIGQMQELSIAEQRALYLKTFGFNDRLEACSVSEWEALLEIRHPPFQKARNNLINSPLGFCLDSCTFLKNFRPVEVPYYYWESDQKWSQLVSAIRENKIRVFSVTPAADECLLKLTQYLSLFKKKVGAIDLSHALDALAPEKADALFQRLSKLPLADNADFLFTSSQPVEEATELGYDGKSHYYCRSNR